MWLVKYKLVWRTLGHTYRLKKIDLASIRKSWRTFLTPWMEIRNPKGFQYVVPHHIFYLKKDWGWFLYSALKYQCSTVSFRNVPQRAYLMHGRHPLLQGWHPKVILSAPMDLSCKILTIWCITLLFILTIEKNILTIEKNRFGIHQKLVEDVPDSLDKDQEPQGVLI